MDWSTHRGVVPGSSLLRAEQIGAPVGSSHPPGTASLARHRILCIEANEDATVGGSYQVLYDVATRMDRSRFDPVALFYEPNVFADRLRRAGVDVVLYNEVRSLEKSIYRSRGRMPRVRQMFAAIIRRAQFLRRERIGLVHLNNAPFLGNDDWLPAARLVGVPCIASAMGGAVAGLDPVRRWLAGRFDRVLPVSQFVASEMVRSGIPESRITTILNGIDAAGYRSMVKRPAAEVRAALGADPSTLLVAMVGNIREWKGQHVVLAALASMSAAERAGIQVIFVGDTSPEEAGYRARLAEQIDTNGLSDTVAFLGRREDVPDLLNAADVAVHASTTPEPFGLVIIEAMALGKPVVAAASGGPLEIVTPDCGFTHDVASPTQLAGILRRLRDDGALRQRVGEGGLSRVQDFALDRTVQRIEEVYTRLLPPRGT